MSFHQNQNAKTATLASTDTSGAQSAITAGCGIRVIGKAGKGDRMSKTELTNGEAFAVAEFIDMNIFTAIRSDEDWDSFQSLRNLCNAYEKCCASSGYVGVTDSAEGGQDNGSD